MILRRHGMLFIVWQNHSNIIFLKASNQLAKEKGWCENFGRTKYSDGILPIDTYKKDVDEISEPKYQHDWESLRASILEHGLDTQHCQHRCHRRAVPLCQMPQTESNHQEITCRLKNQRKILNKWFRLMEL